MQGHQCRVGGVHSVLPGCLGCLCAGQGASGSLACSCSFGFDRGFVDEVGGEERSEAEVEDVHEDEDKEELVLLDDVAFAVMRAGTGLWAAAAPAASTAGRMEGMCSGNRLGTDGWGGLAVTRRPGGPIWLAAVGEGGAGLRSPPSGLGWAGLLQCVSVCGLVSAVCLGCIRGPGGLGLGF